MSILEGWRPEQGKIDKHGLLVDDRIYNLKDFDKNLVIDERTEIVARKVSEFLEKKPMGSTKPSFFVLTLIMRNGCAQPLPSENSDLMAKNSKFVMQITGDNDEGKMELDNFINPEERYPGYCHHIKIDDNRC